MQGYRSSTLAPRRFEIPLSLLAAGQLYRMRAINLDFPCRTAGKLRSRSWGPGQASNAATSALT
eukprot:2983203-Pyramimonas_sp.AAC.1